MRHDENTHRVIRALVSAREPALENLMWEIEDWSIPEDIRDE